MKVLFVSSEAVPFAKTGGLADVAGALPIALHNIGHEVKVIVPKYKRVDKFKLDTIAKEIPIPISNRVEYANLKKAMVNKKVPFYFIEHNRYYNREELYGTSSGDFEDNAERFTYYCRSVLEICKTIDFQPDIIHCNDWQSGLIPVYLKTLYKYDPFFKNTSTVFTYHNIAYQGNFWSLDMHLTGLNWDVFTPEGIEFFGDISFLKAGLVYADIINTVSPAYSRETQTALYGYKLDGILSQQKHKLHGILNGIDYNLWNPENDKEIASKFSPDNLVKGKKINKAELQNYFKLPNNKNVPVLGIVSRLADQKGFDILAESIDKIMKKDVQLIVLGVGDEKYHKLFSKLKAKYSEKIGLLIGFDNKIAKMIYAGSDIFLMPSKYEPCGIGQLISLRYGTLPVVRKTGGLGDTVKNYTLKKGGNGFVFTEYSSNALMKALNSALKLFENKAKWRKLIKDNMKLDFSWESSAREYEKLYKKLIKSKK